MSNAARRSTKTSDRPEYPEIEAAIGEDPARYLSEVTETTFARIRGINDQDVLDAWFRVEEDMGPRKELLRALNDRREALRE